MLNLFAQQRGTTLVELMIATTISLMALASILTVYISTASHSTRQLQQAHLHQQAQAIMQLISSDLKRSGYWEFDPALAFAGNNPFQSSAQKIRVAAYPRERARSCILYSYDLDRDGLVGVGQCNNSTCPAGFDQDNVEQHGFRLRSGRVQSRLGGRSFNCGNGYWQSISDADIEITRLAFSLSNNCTNLEPPSTACTNSSDNLLQHAVEISLHARIASHPASTLVLKQLVRIRNNQLLVRR